LAFFYGSKKMDAIREQLNKPLVAGIVGLVIGTFFGLVVLGWGPLRVQYYDAAPEHLREDLKEDYVRMSIDSYALTGDFMQARQRWEELGPEADEVLAGVQANPGSQSPEAIAAFQSVVQVGAVPGVAITPPVAEAPQAAEETSLIRTILPIMCAFTFLLAGGLVAAFVLRSRPRGGSVSTPAMQSQEAIREAEWTNYASIGEDAPMAQFMASYKLGDDLFDDSFSIDSPGGEFLGECGVGISETIGVGDPKRVTAFEVWLFDKNDIQTVTKVLMSTHAFEDEMIRQRLAAKGEPVLGHPGSQIVLETATLQLEARVIDMSYGEGALPPESFFDNLILELAVWQK
jgi:hypothetical protein